MSASRLPLVGIVGHRAGVPDSGSDVDHVVAAQAYARAVRRAGGLPMVLAHVEPGDAAEYVQRVDALVVTGGPDVDPAMYAADRLATCGPSDPDRDRTDIAFVQAAAAAGVPTLCICRGVQVMNVAFGGTLVQHVDDHMVVDRYNDTVHHVRVAAGSVLGPLATDGWLAVNSLHHQVIDRPGEGVRVTAWSNDGHPEAIEVDGAPSMLGVQWHPELIRHRPEQLWLFRRLIDLSAEAPAGV